jgi:hypothetical protein
VIEVVLFANGWAWRLIGFDGQVLVYTPDRFSTDHAAHRAARAYRGMFWEAAWPVDHRMGACI